MTQGVWDDGIKHESAEWMRDGAVVGTGSTYALTAADVGKVVTARVSARRPDYVQENGTGDVVSFDSTFVDLTSATVVRRAGGGGGGGGGGGAVAPVNTAAADASVGWSRSGQALTANPGTWNTTGLAFTYKWLRDGNPITRTHHGRLPASRPPT